MQRDLQKLAKRCAKWRIKLNPEKTKVIIFSRSRLANVVAEPQPCGPAHVIVKSRLVIIWTCACHREEQTCFCLLFVSVIYITLNNFRILPFILDFISWSRYIFYIHFYAGGFAFKYSSKLILPDQDLSGSHIGFLCVEMAGNSNKNADIDSSFTSVPATQELCPSPEPNDIFLTVQRSTFAVGKIYNDLFANSRSDFISELSELCCVAELRYVRDMVFCIVKRKLGQSNLGSLIERRSGANVKDNLLKDIYNLYSLGEKSIDTLPKNMIPSDTRFCSQEVQTDTCLSNTLFVTKSDVEELKNDFLSKLSYLREEFTSVKCPPAPCG